MHVTNLYIIYTCCMYTYMIYIVYIYISMIIEWMINEYIYICIYILYVLAPPKKNKNYLCLLVMLHYNTFGTIIVPSEYCID